MRKDHISIFHALFLYKKYGYSSTSTAQSSATIVAPHLGVLSTPHELSLMDPTQRPQQLLQPHRLPACLISAELMLISTQFVFFMEKSTNVAAGCVGSNFVEIMVDSALVVANLSLPVAAMFVSA